MYTKIFIILFATIELIIFYGFLYESITNITLLLTNYYHHSVTLKICCQLFRVYRLFIKKLRSMQLTNNIGSHLLVWWSKF